MMQALLLQEPSWPFYHSMNPPSEGDFFNSFTTTEDSSDFSPYQFPSTVLPKEFLEYPMNGANEMGEISQLEHVSYDVDGIETIPSGEIEDVCRWLGDDESKETFPSMESEADWSPCLSVDSNEVSLHLPGNNMEIDNRLSIHHLLKAYGEAMEMDKTELAEVIEMSLIEKASPVGETLERLSFNLFGSMGKQAEHLKQEVTTNYEVAFKAFYQIFPYGKFAHYTANLAILEAMPDEVETVHIVDFDMGEGIQWPPMIEAVARTQKALKLTSVKTGDAPSFWRYEETKRRLYDHARSSGLNLKIDEVGIEDLVSEMKKTKKWERKKEWIAFNCMVGLPHMGRQKIRSHVMMFLRAAQELLAYSNSKTNTGIIIVSDGNSTERLKSCSEYSSFFEVCLNHYQTLYESIEWNFPVCLAEARIAMESLFVSPYVLSLSWLQKWEELREGSDAHVGMGLKGLRLPKESLMEAKEMVKEGKSLFTVRIQGHDENEMVLEWRGSPLITVSAWR